MFNNSTYCGLWTYVWLLLFARPEPTLMGVESWNKWWPGWNRSRQQAGQNMTYDGTLTAVHLYVLKENQHHKIEKTNCNCTFQNDTDCTIPHNTIIVMLSSIWLFLCFSQTMYAPSANFYTPSFPCVSELKILLVQITVRNLQPRPPWIIL